MSREELVEIVIREKTYRQNSKRRCGVRQMLNALLGRFKEIPSARHSTNTDRGVLSTVSNVDLLNRTLPLDLADSPFCVVLDVCAHFGSPDAQAVSKPWIGFVSQPLSLPPWWQPPAHRALTSQAFKESQDDCRGLFVFGRGDMKFLRRHSDRPIEQLSLPCLPAQSTAWSESSFAKTGHTNLVQFEAPFSNQHAIYCFPEDSRLERVRFVNGHPPDSNYLKEEGLLLESNCYAHHMRQSIVELDASLDESLPAEELKRSVALFHLYGNGFCGCFLECISRSMPVLVNRLPGIARLLGEDYPLFYGSYEEALELIQGGKVVDAHTHLAMNYGRMHEQFRLSFFAASITTGLHSEFGGHAFTDHPY